MTEQLTLEIAIKYIDALNKELELVKEQNEKLKYLLTHHEKILKPQILTPYFNNKHEPDDRLSWITLIFNAAFAPYDQFNDYGDPMYKYMIISIHSGSISQNRMKSFYNWYYDHGSNEGYGFRYVDFCGSAHLSYIKYNKLESILKSDLMDYIHDESASGIKIADADNIIHGKPTIPFDSYFQIRRTNQSAYGESETNDDLNGTEQKKR